MANVVGFIKKLGWIGATLASNMPGPIGTIAQAVGKIVGKDLDQAKPDEVVTAINGATPEQMIELQKLEMQHAETMQAAGFKNALDMLSADVEDRKDARARQVSLKDTIFLPGLAVFVIAACTLIFWVSLTGRVHATDVLTGAIIGYVAGMAQQVIAFFFGSSAGSQAKDKMLLEATPPQGDK